MGVLTQIDSMTQGIVPNTLEHIFYHLQQEKKNLSSYSVHLSFFQIYQE
jgi:hypothetical protein